MSASSRALALTGKGATKSVSSSSKVWADTLKLASSPGIVADLGQGWPDLPAPRWAQDVASDVILSKPRLNQYSQAVGIHDLRKNLSLHISSQYPTSSALNPDTQVVVTTSATEALYASVYCVADPGDEILIFEPFFPWYLPMIRMVGAVPVVVTMNAPGFAFDIEEARKKVTSRTKAIIINSPHNPTGHLLTAEEASDLAKLCVEHDMCCISDEVYEDFVFASDRNIRMTDQEGMASRTITIGTASKKIALTGWRVGWAYGENEDLLGAIRVAHSYITFCAPTPMQEAVARALDPENGKELQELLQANKETIQGNASILAQALEKVGAKPFIPEGGHFLIADVRSSGMNANEFCKWLALEKNVIGVPMSVFYEETSAADNKFLVRFAICKTKSSIETAAKAITS